MRNAKLDQHVSDEGIIDAARRVAPHIAARAAGHDRAGSFAFENFDDLSRAGLLSLTVPETYGGTQGSASDAAAVIGIIAAADPSTALVLSMHYIHHWVIANASRWPAHLSRKLAQESVSGIALINALRVEPDLGSPSRGGLPATIARRTDTAWRLSGHKIYSTGAPILKYYAVWAATDEPQPRVGLFLVPAGLAGTRIVETWDHLGLRASGSHDIVFDDVVFPLDHEIDVRAPDAWEGPDSQQSEFQSLLLAAIYDGVARAARDWLVTFLQTRVPANLGASLATLPRMQEVVGSIESILSNNARLISSFAREIDEGGQPGVSEANMLKQIVTNNAVAAVEAALSVTGNHGLSRSNPLERHYRDVLCGRVHTPQDDVTRMVAGRRALGL